MPTRRTIGVLPRDTPVYSRLYFGRLSVLVLLALQVGLAAAQDPPDPAPEPPAAVTEVMPPAPVRELDLGPIILQDGAKGVLMPGVSLEDYAKLLQQARDRLPAPPPAYSLERVELTGVAAPKSSLVTLKVKLQIRLSDSAAMMRSSEEEQVVRVPIGLGRTVLRTPPGKLTYVGDGSARLEYSSSTSEYLCAVRGLPESNHTIEFDAACSLKPDRAGHRLALSLPNAPVVLKLNIPQTPVEASISKGPFHVVTNEVKGGKTNLALEGTGGDLTLSWRRGTRQPLESGPSLTAQTTINVRVQSQLDVRANATLTVSSVGDPLTEFDVRLPPGMKLSRLARQPGFVVREINATDSATSNGDTVRVTLSEPSEAPVQIELEASLARGIGNGRFQAIGFEVLDAVQRGSVTVTSTKGWTAQPMETVGVIRVSPPPESPLGTWQYAFENQPRSLIVQVSPSKSRLHIQPTYVAYIVRGQVNLQAEFKCRLGGADIGSSLSLRMPGWIVREATSDRLDLSEVDLSNVDPLQIPLIGKDQQDREFSVKVDAALSIGDEAESLSFEFPTLETPANTTVTTSSAQLIIAAADDIDIAPSTDQIRGMTPVYSSPPEFLDLPPLQKAPLVFTDLVDDETPQFTGELTYHEQAITADVQSTVSISTSQTLVRQQLRHRISYVPTSHLLLEAPVELLDPDSQLQISQNDQALNYSPVDLPTSIGRAALRVELPERTIGAYVLTTSYRRSGLASEDEQSLRVPLIGPLLPEGVVNHRLQLAVDAKLKLDASVAAPWRREAVGGEVTFTTSGVGQSAAIQLRDQSASQPDGIVVTRTWLQSWLQADTRRDRAVFRTRVSDEQVTIQLPLGLSGDPKLIQTAVNGRRTIHRFEPDTRQVIVPIPADGGEHVIEVWYPLVAQRWLKTSTTDAPYIVDAIELGRSFWEILTPESHQLVTGPSNMTADMQWQWRNGVPQPLANQSTQRLERWIGASTQAPVPSGVKSYLYTTTGAIPASSIRLMSFNRLVVGIAALVLVVGWGCLRWRQLRSPSVLMIWGLILLGVAFSFPSLTWGVGQAVALGAALLAVGQLLQQSLMPTRVPSTPSAPSPRLPQRRVDEGALGTTATASALSVPTADSKI